MKKSKRVVVITGASAGVGRSCAREFARAGYNVGLIARGIDGLKAAREEVEALGQMAHYFVADVSNADLLEDAATEIENTLGPIDVWVNNAMVSVFSPVKEMQAEEYKRVTDVTYLGQVYGAQTALRRMLPRDSGSIVFVGSALAYRGIPLQSAYCASKHAVEGFYDSLRTELLHDGSNVKVSIVELPAMNTTQFGFVKSRLPKKPRPMGAIYQPEVAAEAILFAAENNRRELFVGFSTYKTIVGNKLVPWYADLVLARNGVKGQQTDEEEDPDRQHNLWEPIPGDHGAHGEFGSQAKRSSHEFWLSKNRRFVLPIIAIAATSITWLLTKR